MSFLQKALKVLQEFPNLINEPFQVTDKKKKSFLHEAENFFKNLISNETSENVVESEDDSIQVDLDQPDELAITDDLPQSQILEEEELKSVSNEDQIVPTPIIPEEFDDEDAIVVELEPEDDEESVNPDLPEFEQNTESSDSDSTINETTDDGIDISSLDDFEDIKLDSIDEFTGDSETVNLDEVGDSTDEGVIIEQEELEDSEPKDILEDWEKDAIAETVSDDPFLDTDTDKLHEDVKEAEEILSSLDEEEPEDLEEPVVDVNVEAAFETAKQFKSSYEEKLESYLVLFEITKELLKSKSFDDFFENLMYSIIGQVGPEIMIIFSSRDGNFSQMKIVAHEGIDIEPDYVIKKGDTLYSLLESEKDVVFAKDLLAKDLKDRERVLLENPLTEILIPIRVMDQFSGYFHFHEIF